MAESFQIGKKGKYGNIDFSKLRSNINIEELAGNNDFFKSIFNHFDTENKDGKLSRSELENLINTFKELAGDDSELSKKDAKKLRLFDDKKLKASEAKQVFDFLNKLSEMTKNIKSVSMNGTTEIVEFENGIVEEVSDNGNKKTIQQNGSYIITNSNDEKVQELIKDEKSETIIDYENNSELKRTIKTENEVSTIYTQDGKEIKIVQNINSGIIETYENNNLVKKEDPQTKTLTTIKEGISTITSQIDEHKSIEERKDTNGKLLSKKITQILNNQTQVSETIYDGENSTTTIYFDNKKISQTKNIDGQAYTAKYDGNGNTYVVVQNGESIAMLAKKFSSTAEEIINLNKDSGAVKYSAKLGSYFLVGERIKIPTEIESDNSNLTNRVSQEEAISQYAEFIRKKAEAERLAAEAEAQAGAEKLSIEQKRDNSITDPEVTCVKDEKGNVTYYKGDKELTPDERKAFVEKEAEYIYAIFKNEMKATGTDEDKVADAIKKIYSSEILEMVNNKLSKDYNFDTNKNMISYLEAFLQNELSHGETRAHIRTLRDNKVLSTADLARSFVRELKDEVNGYTGTDELKDIMSLINTPEARVEAEKIMQEKFGMTVREYLKDDGWTEEEIDRFDAVWVQNKAYKPAENVVNEEGEVVSVKDNDQAYRNAIIQRLAFEYDSKESLQAALEAVDTSNYNNETIHSSDYDYLIALCEDKNKTSQIKGQDAVQSYLASRVSKEGIKSSDDVNQLSAFNTLLFDQEKPFRVQAEELIYAIRNGDYEKYFEVTDKNVLEIVNEMLSKEEVSGVKSPQELYQKASSKKNLNIDIKANAFINGTITLDNNEVVDLCIKLMHDADNNYGAGTSTGCSAEGINISDKRKFQLKAILLKNPNIIKSLKAKVEAGKFIATTKFQSVGTSGKSPDTCVIETDTKSTWLDLLKNSHQVAENAVFLDAEGNQIQDEAYVKALIQYNKNSLKDFRDAVVLLERAHKKGVDAEGAMSGMADELSKFIGAGTDRQDVENVYKEAKLLLEKLELAAEGKLRDAEGKVVSAQQLVQDYFDEINRLAQTNSDYKTTIATGKMLIKLAPILVVTTVVTGGAAALGMGTTATAITVGGAAAATNATIDGVELATSYTGNTAEAREKLVEDAAITFALTAIPLKMGMTTHALGTSGTTAMQTLLRKCAAVGIDVTTVAFVSAAAEYFQTGTVNEDAFIQNCIIAGFASGLGHAFSGSKVSSTNSSSRSANFDLGDPNVPTQKVPFYEGGEVPSSHMRFVDGTNTLDDNILRIASVDGKVRISGNFGADKFDDVLAQTSFTATNGTVDDVALTYVYSRQHRGHQATSIRNILGDESGFVTIGKQRYSIADANIDDLAKIRTYVNKLPDNGSRNKFKLLEAIAARETQLSRVAPKAFTQAQQDLSLAQFDDLCQQSSFYGRWQEGSGVTVDPLGGRKLNQYKDELQNLCNAATTEKQLDKLLARANSFRGQAEKNAFKDIISARRAELKATSNTVAQTPTAIEFTQSTRSSQIVQALNTADDNLAQGIFAKKGIITKPDADILESHLVNNLNTKEQIEGFIEQIKNKVGLDNKGRMHVYQYEGTDFAASLVSKAQLKIQNIKASQTGYQSALTLLENANNAQKGLDGTELTAVRSFVENSTSKEEINTILNHLRNVKQSDATRKLINDITAKISTLK